MDRPPNLKFVFNLMETRFLVSPLSHFNPQKIESFVVGRLADAENNVL